ncbi:MAG: FliH/SctL family protein [Oceanicaulis sp.]
MTKSFKPFAFDREFAADGTVLRDGEKIKRVLTEAEAAAMAEQAATAARKGEEAEAARASADALKQIAARLQALVGRLSAESDAMREDAVRLALAAARAVAGAALDNYAADTVEQCVREALSDLRAEPRIAVRVAPALADEIAERLYQFAEREGLEGAVVVRADDECGAGDCVIEWRAGAIERTQADIEARIQSAVENWLARPAEERDAGDDAGGAAA